MYYYAEIDGDCKVVATHPVTEQSTNANYVEITEEQYATGGLVDTYYNKLTGAFELVDPNMWMGDTEWMRISGTGSGTTGKRLSTELENMKVDIANKANAESLADVATSGSYNDLTDKPAAYTHPSTHPASMITGLADVATSGSYNDLSDKPAQYAHPATHPASMITGLSEVATSGSYNDLSDKPTIPTIPASLPANGGNADTVDGKHAADFATANHNHDSDYADADHNHDGDYADATHTHAQSDITGLASALNGKANATHTHSEYVTNDDFSALETAVSGKANASHTHAQYASASDVAALQDEVDGKADANHSHTEYAAASHSHTGYAAASHTHSQYASVTDVEALEDEVAGKADASHTHSQYAASGHTHSNYVTNDTYTSGMNGKANASHTHAQSEISGLTAALNGKASASHSHAQSEITGLATALSGKAATSHSHSQSDVTGLSDALAGKANASHTHTAATSSANGFMSATDKAAFDDAKGHGQIGDCKNITVAGENLDDYVESGTYTFGGTYTPTGIPAGVNGWLVVMRWSTSDTNPTVKQLWFRHGTLDSNDHEIYVRTRTQGENKWSAWSRIYTTSNPPTAAEVGAAASSHNHNSSYISKSLQFTSDAGSFLKAYNVADGKNLLTELAGYDIGFYTVYSQSGVSGNPKTTEAWRMMFHKTGTQNGWIQAYGSLGSVYTNYLDANAWRGWRCIWDNSPAPLWTGAYYMHSPNSTPQTVTPSKKLSECRNGWLLLWSDYDADTSTANDIDFVTTLIPKRNPSGGTWGGKAFLCDIPRHIGSDANDVSTEKRIMKPIYVHDDCIKGSYQNNASTRNDVVLRAVYEF